MNKIRVLSGGLAVVALLAIAGCAPTAPASSPSPTASASTTTTPTPTPTPTQVTASSIVISGTAITVLGGASTVLATIPYSTDGAAAAGQLTTALGAGPALSVVAQANCSRAGTNYDWGGFQLVGSGAITRAPGAIFTVTASSTTASAGVSIVGPGGVHVGTTEADLTSALPSATFTADGFGNNLYNLESTGGSGPDATGVLGIVTGGTLIKIVSPVYISGEC